MDHEEHELVGCFGPLRSLYRKALPERNQVATTCPSGVHERENYSKEQGLLEHKIVETLPPYSLAIEDPVPHPDVLKTVDMKVDKLDPELRKLSLQIHDHPELKFKENFAHDTLTKFMSSHGFNVTPHYLGLSTAWRASFKHGEGGPVLGVNSEMDAVEGMGHACGHNLIAIAGVGVAIGVKAALETHDIAGEVVLLGTPAEEGGGGKIILLERGGYNNMDACIMCHPGPGPELHFDLPFAYAIQTLDVEYFGRRVDGGRPWEGNNPLDAAVLAYTSISALQQQMQPSHLVHGIFEARDLNPDIIPPYVKMTYRVRTPTADEMTELVKRVTACFNAAAIATGCTHKITYGLVASELKHNPALSREFSKVATQRYNFTHDETEPRHASTDFGNISLALPGLHPKYAISKTRVNHTPEFADATRTHKAHATTLCVTKALAATGIRLLMDKKFLKEVKDSFEASKRALKS